jgi:hypothetical protein
MKQIVLSLAFAAAAFAGDWTGHISDDKCGASHSDGAQKSIDCVTSCIKRGGKAVLVANGKVMQIANQDKVAASLYGKKVTVKGDLKGDSLTVASIAAAQ